MAAKKQNWDAKLKGKVKKETVPDAEEEQKLPPVDEAMLKEMCPPEFWDEFKKSKSQGARVDFYYAADNHRKALARDVKAMDSFLGALGRWFMQQLPETDTTGVAGKTARIQIKKDVVPRVTDWPALYTHILKNKAFELLNRAPNAKSMKERWDNKKEIPGVVQFNVKKISLTKIK